MNLTDSQRASSASLLVVAGLAANVVLTLLFYAVSWVVPGSYEGAWPILSELLWLGAVAVLALGLFQLSAAVDQKALLQLAAVVLIVNALVDTADTLVFPRLEGTLGSLIPLFRDFSMLLFLVARGLLIGALVQLTMKTHAWVLPLLGTVALLTVMRTALSVASIHQLVSVELYRSPAYRIATPAMSLFNAVALLIAGLAAKGAVAGGPDTPALVAAAGLRPAQEVPVSPVADFVVGGILLAVGLGVTMATMAAASDGGRYVVATGAIGVGVGRLIRGFIRLGRAG